MERRSVSYQSSKTLFWIYASDSRPFVALEVLPAVFAAQDGRGSQRFPLLGSLFFLLSLEEFLRASGIAWPKRVYLRYRGFELSTTEWPLAELRSPTSGPILKDSQIFFSLFRISSKTLKEESWYSPVTQIQTPVRASLTAKGSIWANLQRRHLRHSDTSLLYSHRVERRGCMTLD